MVNLIGYRLSSSHLSVAHTLAGARKPIGGLWAGFTGRDCLRSGEAGGGCDPSTWHYMAVFFVLMVRVSARLGTPVTMIVTICRAYWENRRDMLRNLLI
jgi:hypothetical protein